MKPVQRRRCSGDESSHAAAAVPSVFASVHRPRHAGISAIKNNPQQHQRPQHRPTYQQYQQQRRLLQQQHQKHQQSQLEFASGHNAAYEQRQQPHLSAAAAAAEEATTAKQSIAVSIAPPPASPSLSATGQQMQQINANMQRQRHPHDVPPTQSSRIPVQQHQQQQQQQQLQQLQQHSHQQNFNQISKTATHLLSGIYEKHLLSQTAFRDNEQQQQQHRPGLAGSNKQMQQWPAGSPRLPGVGELNLSNYVVTGRREQHQQPQRAVAVVHAPPHPPKQQQQQQKPVHFLRLPPPPPPPPVPLAMTDAQQQATAHISQQQFPFSDGCVEPAATTASSRQHFLFESLPSPPPPPAPLNHVYETIKERPPLPTPPAPPERPKPVAAKAAREAPPLPPSRHLKKRSALAAGNSSGRPPKSEAKKCLPAATDEANTCGNATQALWETKKQHSKMLPMQPPSYVHPPPAELQYNTQQRTKADGEQNPRIYMQLRDQQQLQQGHVQHPAKLNAQQQHQKQQQQHKQQLPHLQLPVLAPAQPVLQQRHPCHMHMREHPVGAIDAKPKSASESSPAAVATATAIIAPSCSAIGVEQALQHAGLLQSTSSSACPVFPSSSAAPLPLFTANSTAHNNRPSALSIVFEEDTGEFQDVLVLEQDGTAKLPYRHGKIEVRLETAQAMAAAAYYARAAQKLAQSGSTRTRSAEMQTTSARNGGFCGALQRTPPPVPSSLARRLANKENFGIGKVKVMLRVSDTHVDTENPHFMSVDKKKRQVTLTDPAAASSVAASTSQERGPMVAAPKMFAFDSLFTAEDQQSDICASALSEVIPAVLEGSDGCLLTIGYPSSGQSQTMLGGVNPPGELGAIPCAISWLYKGINERRQRSGARFSVRVSALGVSATKPDSSSKDLLAAHATESDDSPGIYLRDDFLGGPTELRAPTAERAALFLDAALAGRPHGGLQPAMIFTLHVYQYSLSRKGGVAGGRSRLHLIDLGGCANRNGGLPLSGVGNILLAILSGQRHPPNKDHPLTPLLKDCLAPLTCHVAIMAHVTHTQSHTDALTTIQLASRIHRMRRRKHRFPLPSDKTATGLALNGGHQSTGSSAGSGADPSSSELSADTVIYMGPSDDATDGEHPPVYLPSLSSGDNRGVMSKVLKGSGLEKQQPPAKAANATKKSAVHKAPQSPVIASRTDSLKRGRTNSPIPQQPSQQQNNNEAQFYSPAHSSQNLPHSVSSPKIVAGSLRHPSMAMMSSKGSNMPSPKGSPLRRPGVGCGGLNASEQVDCPGSPMRKIMEEQWIDGPRVSRAKVAEARHLLREVNHVKQCETWIDGPKSQSSRSLTAGNLPTAPSQVQGYGFMDSHKKSMIRQWVENQTSQVFQSASAASSPTHGAHRDQQAQHLRNITFHMSQLKQKSLDAPEDLYASSTRQPQHLLNHQSSDQHSLRSIQLGEELVHPIGAGLTAVISTTNASAPAEIRGSALYRQRSGQGHSTSSQNQTKDETDFLSTHSLHSNGDYDAVSITNHLPIASASDAAHHSDRQADQDEDQDSGPSEVPPALPLIEPLGSREISHESLHRILSRHVSRESLYQQQTQDIRRQEEITIHSSSRQSLHHHSQHSMSMSDCGLQVTEEEIARTMAGEHPLAALSHCDNMSIVSSFHMAGDAFSDCAMGERTRNQFDQLARLREIFTSQLAMAEVTPVFRSGCDVGSVYSEPAYRFNTGPGSVCSEPPYRLPSPRQLSRSPSQGSLPSLNGIMQIAGMEQYASLRHPDGASDPNLPKVEKPFVVEHEEICDVDEKSALLASSKRPSVEPEGAVTALQHSKTSSLPVSNQSQLPLLPLNTSSEAYDSGHDSSTPRTSKHSGISRRAESGYHSVATARDSDESSFTSGLSKEHHNRITVKKRRQDKGLCNWLMNPFTCTYPETEGEISDF